MTQLSDTQSILLSNAARRDEGSLYPLPTSITAPAAAVAKSVGSLIKRGLAEERVVDAAALRYRDDDERMVGVFITAAGKAAIGIEDEGDEEPTSLAPVAVAPERVTKGGAVLALLQRDGGATLEELIAVTGWLPHTTRAALTGLRKKGHAIARGKRDGATCYSIAVTA